MGGQLKESKTEIKKLLSLKNLAFWISLFMSLSTRLLKKSLTWNGKECKYTKNLWKK